VRLGVGVGWQESEYEALGESFRDRGARMDEAIRLLRAYWTDAEVNLASAHYPTVSMAMEPKPPQGGRLPVWIGGGSGAADRPGGRPPGVARGRLGARVPRGGRAGRRLAREPRHRRGERAARHRRDPPPRG